LLSGEINKETVAGKDELLLPFSETQLSVQGSAVLQQPAKDPCVGDTKHVVHGKYVEIDKEP
jgi:hypothetical protein